MMVVHPTSTDSALVTSLATSIASMTKSRSVITETTASSVPSASATPVTTLVEPASSADDSSDDDPYWFITVQRMTNLSSLAQD